MRYFLFVLALICTTLLFSQSKEFTINGTIKTEDTKEVLESATVYLERVTDSSLVTYTISDKNGKFSLQGDSYDDELNLYVSFIGYKNYYQRVELSKEIIDLGVISLQINDNVLDEIVIKSRAPITIKKDTVEFNVKSFKTKKDANVEDLLKQLPGVEVDEAGKITVNGKDVSNILVNGKPFFGDDPTITTRNLTKEIIEKVQITDTKTKSEAFTGEEGDSENKTINLTIKEENNKGVFGRVAAGGGTDERYEFAGMVNLFDNDRRISVLAGGNNTNSPGFSFGEIEKMFGRAGSISVNGSGGFSFNGRSFGFGEGITTSRNAGANYADKVGKKVDISADYFYSGSNSENETVTERENFLPDSRFFTDSNSEANTESNSHSTNLEFDIEVDSTFLINIRPSFRFTKTNAISSSDEETRDEANSLTNESSVSTLNDAEAKRFGNDFSLTKRFGDKGSFLRFYLNADVNKNEEDDFLQSETNFINNPEDNLSRDQFTDSESDFANLSTSATYRLPLKGKDFSMDFQYEYRNEKRENLRSTFDFNDSTNAYDLFNTDLSTDFEYTNQTSVPSLGLRYRKDKLSTSLTWRYVFRDLENQDFLRPGQSIQRNFEATEIRANFSYRFSDKESIYTGYTKNNEAPDLNQLQTFQNVSNPLNTIVGNPNLRPTNNHRVHASYNAYDFQKRSGFYGYLSLNMREDQVVSKTNVDPETLRRTTTYANVDGAYNLWFNASYSKGIKLDSLKTLKYDVSVNTSLGRNINFNNDVQYESRTNSITPRLGLRFTWPKVMEIRPRYGITFSKNTFDIEMFDDREFLRHDLDLNLTTYVPKNFEWINQIDFSYNPNVAPGFQKSVWFWNSSLAYSFMQDKLIATLKVYDLLNQNNNSRRIANNNFIQDSQSTVLQQFFMLSLSWKFNSLGSKGETDDSSFFILD